jgi:hypothetical protein
MSLILDTVSATCAGHTEEEVKVLTDHVCLVYKKFYQAQLATLNSSLPKDGQIDVIDDDHELTLDKLDSYDLGPLFCSWTKPGYPLLGTGAYRAVIGLCDEHVLKVNPGEINHNALEAETWFSIPDNLLPVFVPVIAAAPGAEPLWLITARATPLEINPVNDEMAEGIGRMLGLEDLHSGNLGYFNGSLVLLDYGHTMQDLEVLLSEFASDPFPVELIG